MLPLAADKNFNNDILHGLLRRQADLDIVRVQDAGLSGADDASDPQWAAREDRVLRTHDVATITKYAYARILAGLSMPGVFEVGTGVGTAQAIEDLLLLA